MMNASVQTVLTARARLGESPVWDTDRQQLFWVDIFNYRVHQFDSATKQDRYWETGEVVSAIALAGRDRLLIALRDRLAFLDIQTGGMTPLHQVEFPHPSDTRWNDGKCDAQGRFWIGSCSDTTGQAALYRYDPDGSFHTMETGLTISNGLGWSPDESTFYLTDSAAHKIYAYDFNEVTGSMSNRRIFVDLTDEGVEPDGLAIDNQGNLWSALWGGWCLVCFNPHGQEILRIDMPVQCPTSLTFAGSDLTELYITSASIGLSQQDIQKQVGAGDLFHLKTRSQGMLTHHFSSQSA